jgi:hypothetical protein
MFGVAALYGVCLVGMIPIRVLGIPEHITVALSLGVFVYEYVIDSHWKREWASCHGPSGPDPRTTSERGKLFYTLGLIQLYVLVVGLITAIYWSIINFECFTVLLFGMAVAYGLFRGARRLAPIPDSVQTDAKKMAEFGLEPMATEAEMTRTGIIAIGAGVLFTLAICLRYLYDSIHR